MIVEYRGIKEFPGYRVSNIGEVWSQRKSGKRGRWKKLKPAREKEGYLYVRLYVSGRQRYMRVARLVLLAFVGPPPLNHEAAHEDGNPENNRLENLHWKTHQANMADAIRHGTTLRGERNSNAKLTDKKIETVFLMRKVDHCTYREIANFLDVSEQSISRVLLRKTWKHLLPAPGDPAKASGSLEVTYTPPKRPAVPQGHLFDVS